MTRSNIWHKEITKGICGAFNGYMGEIDLGDENTVSLLATGIEVRLSENLAQHGFVVAPIEPTNSMSKCGGDVLGGRSGSPTAKQVWAAMIGVVKRMPK